MGFNNGTLIHGPVILSSCDKDNFVLLEFVKFIYCGHLTEATEMDLMLPVSSRSLAFSDTNLRDMTASVTSPSGQKTACEIVPVDADHYNIKFIPQEMGEHLVTVKHRGINIAGKLGTRELSLLRIQSIP